MLGLFFLILIVGMQLIPVEMTNPQSDPKLEIKAPADVQAIFVRSCYDCHSNHTKWPWYSHVAPVKWFVARDVKVGRQWLNFSEWETYDEAKKEKLKAMIFKAVGLAMPLGLYVKAHPEAALSAEDKQKIREWTGINPEDIMNNPKKYLY
ncbi:MAG: heme-binding domain-containing protein [Epsilonproteobacteria bacterium]|nr:heme-binding domain-containing protein [Campylobacterota bacterium]